MNCLLIETRPRGTIRRYFGLSARDTCMTSALVTAAHIENRGTRASEIRSLKASSSRPTLSIKVPAPCSPLFKRPSNIGGYPPPPSYVKLKKDDVYLRNWNSVFGISSWQIQFSRLSWPNSSRNPLPFTFIRFHIELRNNNDDFSISREKWRSN